MIVVPIKKSTAKSGIHHSKLNPDKSPSKKSAHTGKPAFAHTQFPSLIGMAKIHQVEDPLSIFVWLLPHFQNIKDTTILQYISIFMIKVSLLTAYYFSSRPFAQKMVHSGVTENTSFEHFPVCYNQLRYTKSCEFYCR